MVPRFRFAPSPTGYLHIGGARTALFNYLLAKKMGGKFVLRIEDTDLERSSEESIEAILEGMKWLGLEHDEGPFFQTKRFDLYQEYIEKLISEKKAYPCFCTPEVLDEKRQQAQKEKRKPMYDRTCLSLSADQVEELLSKKTPHCIRFQSPDEGKVEINDLVKGQVIIENKELDDLIIRRTDGSPTYNLTVVIDDATMNITHVVRGDDHLNNTPRQIQLYQALGFELPEFAHVPMILGSDKKRLSKRHGATSVIAYKDMGYLPEALKNYLVRLGWSFKDQEIFSEEEMINAIDFSGMSKSAAVFNPEKLDWLNGHYIREGKPSQMESEVKRFLELHHDIKNSDPDKLRKAIEISQSKVKTLVEMADFMTCLFQETKNPDQKIVDKFLNEKNRDIILNVYEKLSSVEEWTEEKIREVFDQITEESEMGFGKIAQPIRVALSLRKASPGIFEMLILLGKEVSLNRIKKELEKIKV